MVPTFGDNNPSPAALEAVLGRPSGWPSPFHGFFPSSAGKLYASYETLSRIEGALFHRERARFGVVRKAKNMGTTMSK